MIDKISRKALKFISKNGEISLDAIYANFGEYGEQIINSLCVEGYVKQVLLRPTFNINEFTYAITPKGKAYFEERRSVKIHFWIPIAIDTVLSLSAIVISVIALIK